MDEHRNPEQWADALLEQHRTAPRDTEFDDEPVIQYLRERSKHHAARSRHFANIEAAVTLVGVVLLCVFGYAFYSGF
jgi:hypothetical protein